MPLRKIRDSEGREWTVWSVQPELRPRRVLPDRRIAQQPYTGPDRRRIPDRRMNPDRRALVPPGTRRGWLCFQNGAETRRIALVPDGWENYPEWKLEALLRYARPSLRRAVV